MFFLPPIYGNSILSFVGCMLGWMYAPPFSLLKLCLYDVFWSVCLEAWLVSCVYYEYYSLWLYLYCVLFCLWFCVYQTLVIVSLDL